MENKGGSLKKVIYVLLPFVVYVAVHDVARILMMFLLQFLSSHSAGAYSFIKAHDAFFSGVISMIDMAAGALMVIYLMKRDIEELSIWDYVNLNGISFYRADKRHPASLSWIILVIQSVSMALGLNLLIKLTGFIRFSPAGEKNSSQYMIPLWFGIILYGIISPAVEELIFRTVMYGRMKRRFNLVIAVTASSMFFGLYHGNLVQGIYGFFMGLLMCLACEYVHTVVGAFLMHALANLVIYVCGLYGLLEKMDSPVFCYAFLGIGLTSLCAEIIFCIRSKKTVGTAEGETYVGCFYREN